MYHPTGDMLILLDLSAAFDTIHHYNLFYILQEGITYKNLKFTNKSYYIIFVVISVINYKFILLL